MLPDDARGEVSLRDRPPGLRHDAVTLDATAEAWAATARTAGPELAFGAGEHAWHWPAPPARAAGPVGAPRLVILGSRGVPGRHGGFEAFATRLAPFLVARGWRVTVACQSDDGSAQPPQWQGVRLVHHHPRTAGPLATIETDLRAVLATLRRGADIVLTLGYNTALFGSLLRAARIPHLMNMDGIEWRRSKWSRPVRAWFWANERMARFTADHLIADHPEIAEHLARHVPRARISMIPYGGDAVAAADPGPAIARFGIEPGRYAAIVARPEPENSILELVQAFSRRPRGCTLLVLGRLDDAHPYHRAVRAAASADVRFAGPEYDATVLASMRAHSRLYLHGHRVGGTNPSLVEALGAGTAVLAHDNRFNRWVAGAAAAYFTDADDCDAALDRLLAPGIDLGPMRAAARSRHAEAFRWPPVLAAYEALLARFARARPALNQPVAFAEGRHGTP